MVETTCRWVGRSHRVTTDTFSISRAPETARGRPRALVVEDSLAVRAQVTSTLTQNGYDVASVEAGLEGLKRAEENPDIILVDLHLPDISGLTLCKTLRTSNKTSHIPVVILTAENTPKTIAQAFRNGAADFINKPFVDEVLILRLNRIVRERINEAEATRRFETLNETHRALAAARADLLMQQRLSSLGMMMSGLAHEMNSPLGAQIASLQYVLEGRADSREDELEAISDALKAGERVAELVRRMRGIAGSEDRTPQPVALRRRVEMVATGFPMLAIEIVGDDIVVNGVETEIREAIGALLDNAVRAAARTDDPRVRISLRVEGGFAAVVVEDNGSGIADEDLPFILTPFFTRHRGSRAMGLGLSLVDAAARRHRGRVVVDGHGDLGGARATLLLPLQGSDAEVIGPSGSTARIILNEVLPGGTPPTRAP